MANALLHQLTRHPDAARWISPALSRLSPDSPHPVWTTHNPRESEGPLDPDRYLVYWTDWYQGQFQKPFQASTSKKGAFVNAEALFDFLASDLVQEGDPKHGKDLFEKAQCLQCHGGDPLGGGRLFGPDLTGVTSRLNPTELAESIAFPSRTVAERYQATEVELKNGTVWTGFITQQTPQSITLATQESIQQISPKEVHAIQPQTLSLMPEGLLNDFSREDIKDLMAFLRTLGN